MAVLFLLLKDKRPKASIPLLSINVMFDAPCLSEHPFSILITYLTYGKSRSIFVYAESGHVSVAIC